MLDRLLAGTRSTPRRRDALTAVDRLALLTADGLATGTALSIAARSRGGAGPLLRALHRSVRSGRSLSTAMTSWPKLFRPTEVALLRAAEDSGTVGHGLHLLQQRMLAEQTNRHRVTAALAYPVLLVILSSAALLFLATAVLPAFVDFYTDAGRPLPVLTASLVTFGVVVTAYGPSIVVVAALLLASVATIYAYSPVAASALDAFTLRLPVAGTIVESREKAAAYATAAAVIKAGGDCDRALQLAADVTANRTLRRRLIRTARLLTRGLLLSRAWVRSGLDRAGQERDLLEICETTGDYAAGLARLGRLAEAEGRSALDRVVRFAEPVAVSFMAVVVGAACVALYQPILGSAAMLSGGSP